MAGSMKDIKLRIKSVESTMQITKAMELVASSKMRRAKERVEHSRPYFETLYESLTKIAAADPRARNPYLRREDIKRTLLVVIAGDRGLAGGYNANVFKQADAAEGPVTVLPIGKRSAEYFAHHGAGLFTPEVLMAADVSVSECFTSDSFLRIDRNESVLGTFFSNMNRQYDRPSDFRFYHLPVEMLSTAKDLVEIFKFPKENEQLLSSYAIDIRQPAQEQSITGDTPQQTTRWGVDEVDWQQLARMGVTPESLGETGMQRLLNGHESAVLDIRISFEGIDFETPACIRLVESAGGKPVLNVECCKRYPELDRPYMGTELSPEVKENLSKSNNAGCVVELELAEGVREPCLLSLNPKTNRLHHVPVSEITIPQEVNRVRLSDDQITRLPSIAPEFAYRGLCFSVRNTFHLRSAPHCPGAHSKAVA